MTVLIFHDSQKLKLIKLQKTLIQLLNKKGITYAHKPLFVELPFINDEENLKQSAGKIKNIQLEHLEQDERMIFCNVKIEYENATHSLKMPFIHFFSQPAQLQDKEAAILFHKDFPQKVSVFRLGKKIDLNKNAQVIENSIWKKL